MAYITFVELQADWTYHARTASAGTAQPARPATEDHTRWSGKCARKSPEAPPKRKRSPAPPPPATASGTATLATVAAATEGAVALASDIHADISARELPALNRAAERTTALFRCVRPHVVLGQALACCADVKEAHVVLAAHPYAEQGGVLAMGEFLNRDPPPDCGVFIYVHALQEPSLIALLPSTFGSLTRAKREQTEAAYREASPSHTIPDDISARFQPDLRLVSARSQRGRWFDLSVTTPLCSSPCPL